MGSQNQTGLGLSRYRSAPESKNEFLDSGEISGRPATDARHRHISVAKSIQAKSIQAVTDRRIRLREVEFAV